MFDLFVCSSFAIVSLNPLRNPRDIDRNDDYTRYGSTTVYGEHREQYRKEGGRIMGRPRSSTPLRSISDSNLQIIPQMITHPITQWPLCRNRMFCFSFFVNFLLLLRSREGWLSLRYCTVYYVLFNDAVAPQNAGAKRGERGFPLYFMTNPSVGSMAKPVEYHPPRKVCTDNVL